MFILTKMSTTVNDFEKLKLEYKSCPDFCDIYATLKSEPTQELDSYTLHEGIYSRLKAMHSKNSLREFLV